MKILLVEDDEALIAVLTKSLTAHHYVVDAVKDGEAGWIYGSTFDYDLIVLDIMLPKLDGIHLCQRFRAEGYTTPILLLTAQDTSNAKVKGLDAGADDYVVKPFDVAELIARIRALLRRGKTTSSPVLTWEKLCLNPSTCEVTYNNQPLTLTTKEYDLLELLLWDGHHVFSTDEILDRLWSSEEFPAEATVRSHIRRLRHKLSAVGAPPDFIGTMHGRGYYLKPSTRDSGTQPTSAPPSKPNNSKNSLKNDFTHDPEKDSKHDPSSTQHTQYLAFLNETWVTTKPKCLEQVAMLAQIVQELDTTALRSSQQKQAQQITHKLAGTLGIFGLTKAMQTARHLEHLFSDANPLPPKHAALLETLVNSLHEDIHNTTSIQLSSLPTQHSPLLLIVDHDVDFTRPLVTVAENRGLRTAIAPTIADAQAWLTTEPKGDTLHPDLLLLRLPSSIPQTDPTPLTELSNSHVLEWIQALQGFPTMPLLVVGNQDELTDRLEVARWGGKFLLEQSVTAEQIIAFAVQLLGTSTTGAKVMVVDDDQAWLNTLPTLLKPWGLDVTTLADPQQFWTMLKTVNPDVLVLDVKMPQVNGLELCQVLRSDPSWQRLPVLFLSVLTDPKTQNQAFTVGADDYLCKPVMGADLANRILNRLQRLRSWAS